MLIDVQIKIREKRPSKDGPKNNNGWSLRHFDKKSYSRSFSRKRRISTKVKSECGLAADDSSVEIASPTLTHVISKKRSRLTTSTCDCDLTTLSGENATISDEENNEDAEEVKCMPSPGSKCKSCKSSFIFVQYSKCLKSRQIWISDIAKTPVFETSCFQTLA